MKKFFPILFFIFLVFFSRQVFATAVVTKPVGVDLSGQNGPNPAPPIGLTVCGKTMCNENEVCIKYPMEEDDHCVPKTKIPLTPPITPPRDLPLDENGNVLELCPEGEGVFPPNSTCINRFKNAVSDITEYQKTCIYEPIVEYTHERGVGTPDNFEEQGYLACGNTADVGGGSNPPPQPNVDPIKCAISMLVYTDVRDAELGSYGPDNKTREEKSSDFVAQNYLYDSLFGKPMDLNTSKDNPNNNREAYRTYWRLLSASTQANLRSFTLNMANNNQINNIRYEYTDTDGKTEKTDLKSIYLALKSQIILFFHFPFIRVGCLTDYPVCPEYAQAIKELKPFTQNITDYLTQLAEQLPLGASTLVGAPLQIYKTALAAFGGDLDGPYSAFVPLDHDSIRSYIVKRKDDFEEQFYVTRPDYYINDLKNILNVPRYGTDKPTLTNLSRENIPYVGAIYQGLLSPKFGILASLQPSWLIDTYATPGGIISDYKRGNAATDTPEVKLAKIGFLDFITQQIGNSPAQIASNTVGWIYEQVKDLFTKEEDTKLKGYTKNDEDLPKEIAKLGYVNYKSCPLPVSYHLLSSKTAPDKSIVPPGESPYDDHHQVVTIMGDELKWTFAPSCKSREEKEDCDQYGRNCVIKRTECPDNHKTYPEGEDVCCTRKWKVYGVRHGKALAVLNNPKETDIKNAVVQDSKFSLYKTLIPDAFNKKKITDASIDAPYAAHYSAYLDDKRTATAPNGQSRIINEVEPINRINNRAQDTTHLLQNCWTLPEDQQNSPRCKLALVESATESTCTGEAFSKIAGDVTAPSDKAQSVWGEIESNLSANPDLVTAYSEAEKQTGVPCEVLAGIHYEEADNDPNKDLQSGGDLAGRSLTESAIQAANELSAKVGSLTDLNSLIKALSWYNGGGNSNCQAGGSNSCTSTTNGRCGSTVSCGKLSPSASIEEIAKTCTCGVSRSEGGAEPGSCRDSCQNGFPFQFSYNYCPPPTTGYDDPYVTNWWKSPEHDNMYLLYMYDCTATKPQIHERPGSLTVAIMYYLSHKK